MELSERKDDEGQLAMGSLKSRTTANTMSRGGSGEIQGLSAGDLISLCEETLKTFDPVVITVDSHAEETLAKRSDVLAPDKEFVKQVLYGCVRYKAILKTLITSFYFNNGATTSRGDYTKYMILSYLALLRLEELGFPAFARLVRSQAAEKMHVFLSYIFDKATLEKWVKDKWIQYYDLNFVEKVIIANVDRAHAQAKALCDELSEAAFGLAQRQEESSSVAGISEVLKKPPTIPKPFNITPVRPVRVPEPMKIKQCITANPVPKTLNLRSLADIEAEREAAKEQKMQETRQKYEKDESFKLSETKDTLSRAVEAQERELNKILNKKFRANPVPDFESQAGSVKLNTAAILREDALYKKKQEQEAQLLQEYEENLRDSTEFYKWQTEQRQEDERNRMRQVEERRLASVLSQQKAKMAQERKLEENQSVVRQMNVESKEIQVLSELQKEEQVEGNRSIVNEIQARRNIPQKEREKVVERNREQMKQAREEQKEREAQKKIDDAKELELRNDMIRRIRALERVPVVRVTQFDPTKSGGHGLLEEMSLVELKERLAMNEIKFAKEKDEIRRKIISSKVEKEKAMKNRLHEIRRAREAAAAANRKARREQRERDEERQRLEQELRDEAKLGLVDRLAEIRASRETEIRNLQEEETRLQKRNMFLGAAKEMVEAKVHEEFIKGMERKARTTQRTAQAEAASQEFIKNRDLTVRNEYRRHQALTRRQAAAEAAASLQAAREKTKAKNFAVFKTKRSQVQSEHERRTRVQKHLDGINPYATRIKDWKNRVGSPASMP